MARSLLIVQAIHCRRRPLLSVTPEAAANAAFQAAPYWSPRADRAPANDVFGALVNENAGNNGPPPQAHLPRRSDENVTPANNAAPTAYSADSQPTNNDANNNAKPGPPSSANAGAGNNVNNGSASGAATQPSTTTSDPSKGGSNEPPDKPDGEDTSTSDATALAQQTGLTALTPIPVAVAVPIVNQPANAPS